jgi:diacylglycerol kinase family enzyme
VVDLLESNSAFSQRPLDGLGMGDRVVRVGVQRLDHPVEQARAEGRTATTALYVRTAVRRYLTQSTRRHVNITVTPAGRDTPLPPLAVVVVSNCSPWTYLGSRPLRPTPHADFDAGLDVFGLARLSLLPTLTAVAQMTTRRGPRGRRVVSLHDQPHFTIVADSPMPVQVDGDYIGERDTLAVSSVPNAVRIVY